MKWGLQPESGRVADLYLEVLEDLKSHYNFSTSLQWEQEPTLFGYTFERISAYINICGACKFQLQIRFIDWVGIEGERVFHRKSCTKVLLRHRSRVPKYLWRHHLSPLRHNILDMYYSLWSFLGEGLVAKSPKLDYEAITFYHDVINTVTNPKWRDPPIRAVP